MSEILDIASGSCKIQQWFQGVPALRNLPVDCKRNSQHDTLDTHQPFILCPNCPGPDGENYCPIELIR